MTSLETKREDTWTASGFVHAPEVWQRVRRAVARSEYVAIVGPKRCGKSELLKDILNDSAEPGVAQCLYVDLHGWRTYHSKRF
jgi:ABC-type phosphate/phosphonate transport system ATPase subunit